MKKVRNQVFETNSSSTHSISFTTRDYLEENKMIIDDDGYIHAEFGEYGWEIESYYDQESKLSYLLTMTAQVNGMYPDCYNHNEQLEMIDKFMETDDFKEISDAIAEYANCRGVVIDDSCGYIDHQSVYGDSLNDFLDDCGVSDVVNFVYGNVVVHTDNDNY